MYAFLGSAHHISLGTMAVVDIMLKGTLDKYTAETNGTLHESAASMNDLVHPDASRIQVMTTVCLMTGLWQILLGIIGIGSVSLIFSDQLISGFSASAAITVVMSQVPTALGIQGVLKSAGPLSLIRVSDCTGAAARVTGSCNP